MKFRKALALLAVLALTITACTSKPPAEEAGGAETETQTQTSTGDQTATEAEQPATSDKIPAAFANPDDPVRIALVREVGEGGFMERYLAGAQSMADALGVELIDSNARGDQAKMVTMVENAIQQQVDAIIVDHGRTDTLQPAIEEALRRGIKVVTFDLVIDNPEVTEIEQDDMYIGFTLAKKLATDFGGQANVTYINVGGFAPLVKRDRSWQNFKWRYSGLNEVAHIGAVTDNTAADTMARMEATLKEYPETNAVLAMWDEFAKGATRAIMQAGKQDQVKVYSVDITNEDIQLMRQENSPWVATVATDSYNVGRLAVRAAAAKVAGMDLPKYLLVEPTLVTRDFLLEHDITNMDELVKAKPSMGESSQVWPEWMLRLLAQNGAPMPAIATTQSGGSSAAFCTGGYSSATIPAPFNAGEKPRVALVREVGEGGFMERYLAGAQSMADTLGVELIDSNARGDQAKMVTMIENAIQQQVDAIIVDHGRTDTLQPAIEEALRRGIKVITFDLVIDNPEVTEIEQDDMLIGFTLSKKLATDFGGQANVTYINVGGFAPLVKRDRSWQDFKWRYSGLNEVAHIGAVTDNTAADTMARMEATLKEYPETNAVLAMWDEFAKGATRAIMQAGKQDQIKVYSVDITNEDIQLMRQENSPWVATVATDSYNVGRLAVRSAAAAIAGEDLPKYLLVEPSLITRDFLLEHDITNMDELVEAMPAMGESPQVWPDWMCKLANP